MTAFLLNPRHKRKRKYGKRKYGKRKAYRRRRWYGRRRRPLTGKSAIRTRLYRMGRRAGLIEGGQKCARAVSAIRSGTKRRSKKELAAIHGPYASTIPVRLLATNRRGRRARFNYRHRRRRRNYSTYMPAYSHGSNPYWTPQYAMNQANLVGQVTAGFRPRVLMQVLPYAGGAIGNAFVSAWLSRFMPAMLQSGAPNLLVGLASAGLLGAGVGMVSPRFGRPVFFGGLIEVATRGLRTYALPAVQRAKAGLMGMLGLDDYLTVGDAAAARPLYGLDACCPSLGQYDLQAWGIGQELDVGAQSLDDMLQTNAMNPESMMPQLTFRGIGYTMNDAAIEGTATDELGM